MKADDILMPHTPEVLAAMLQKRLDDAEEMVPGIIEKVREWVLSDEFKKVFDEVPEHTHLSFRMSSAPLGMTNRIAKLYGIPMSWPIGDRPVALDSLNWVADYIWKSEGMSEKYYKNHTGR